MGNIFQLVDFVEWLICLAFRQARDETGNLPSRRQVNQVGF